MDSVLSERASYHTARRSCLVPEFKWRMLVTSEVFFIFLFFFGGYFEPKNILFDNKNT